MRQFTGCALSQFFRGVAGHLAHFAVYSDESSSDRVDLALADTRELKHRTEFLFAFRQLFVGVLGSGGFDGADHGVCRGCETGQAGQQPRVLGIELPSPDYELEPTTCPPVRHRCEMAPRDFPGSASSSPGARRNAVQGDRTEGQSHVRARFRTGKRPAPWMC